LQLSPEFDIKNPGSNNRHLFWLASKKQAQSGIKHRFEKAVPNKVSNDSLFSPFSPEIVSI